jgi:glycolate oxidase FAD binding subunit
MESTTTEEELAQLIAQSAKADVALRLMGNGTHWPHLAPCDGVPLSSAGLSGITLYEPGELVLSARAGTPLSEIETLLENHNQMLPFEPSYGSIATTIGSVAAMNRSGPRRITAGACRDSLIGVRFINGRGEIHKNGGRVMKNVTGLDLVKLHAGAFGTLGMLTEVTFKLLPKPETQTTLVYHGLSHGEALALMSEALRAPYSVSAAAHLMPAERSASETRLRLEGFEFSVKERTQKLVKTLQSHAKASPEILDHASSKACWEEIKELEPMPANSALWRLSVPASSTEALIDDIITQPIQKGSPVLIEWGGARVFVADLSAEAAQNLARKHGGFARMVRSGLSHTSPSSPLGIKDDALITLTKRVKSALDPSDIFNRAFLAL